MRLSTAQSSLFSPRQAHQEEPQNPSCSPSGRDSIRGGSGGGENARGVPGLDNTVHGLQRESGGGSGEDRLQAEGARRGGDTRSSSDGRREGADKAGEKITGTPSGGGSDGPPMLSACESDIWSWALMVLQMFSDELWPPGNGQVRFTSICDTSVELGSSTPSNSCWDQACFSVRRQHWRRASPEFSATHAAISIVECDVIQAQ